MFVVICNLWNLSCVACQGRGQLPLGRIVVLIGQVPSDQFRRPFSPTVRDARLSSSGMCNTQGPVFTGLPRLVQNLPFLTRWHHYCKHVREDSNDILRHTSKDGAPGGMIVAFWDTPPIVDRRSISENCLLWQ